MRSQHQASAVSFPEKTPSPIGLEAGWAQKPVWKDLEEIKSLTPAGIRTPDLPANKMVMSGFLWFNNIICLVYSLTPMS